VFWIDLDTDKQAPPYEATDLLFARTQLMELNGQDVSPKALDDFKRQQAITLPFKHTHVLRRRDLLELFDTSPDLSGNDIDIQRFVRGDDPETDVGVFWRQLADSGGTTDQPSPQRSELCSVPATAMKAFLKKDKVEGFIWDHIDGEWRQIREPDREIHPGLTVLLPTRVGGYSELGWDSESKTAVVPLPPAEENGRKAEGFSSDPRSSLRKACTIADHTQHVCDELAKLLKGIHHVPGDYPMLLAIAARWHDVGKAHAVFQAGMHSANPSLDPNQLWAKSGTDTPLRYCRKHFRHELASALAALQRQLPFTVAYLIAAHHGRVRLAIRALPGEVEPKGSETRFALGVHHNDPLPTVQLGDGQTWQEAALDLTPMQLGGDASWTAHALKLLADLGPFQLAYLETLLRAADVRASQEEAKR
jgi:CRISPR-associated endonuclease/helicase Cas3